MPPILSRRMYTPYFEQEKVYPLFQNSYPLITRHIPHITGSVSINLKCVPYSETPNFDPDHTPYAKTKKER